MALLLTCGTLLGAAAPRPGHAQPPAPARPAVGARPPSPTPTPRSGGGGATPTLVVGGDQNPPSVWFDPDSATVGSQSLSVTISWCDDQTLTASSRSVTLDGQAVSTTYATGTYSGCTRYATSVASVTLPDNAPHTLAASISDGAGNVGSYSARYTYSPSGPGTANGPAVAVVSPQLFRDPRLCALNCGEVVTSYSTPAYASLDAARAVTLVYRSGRAHPQPVVQLDVTSPAAGTAKVGVRLQTAAGAFLPLNTGTIEVVRQYAPGQPNRMAVQVDAGASGLGGYTTLTAVVTAYDANNAPLGSTPMPVTLLLDNLNGPASPYGAGWGIAGLQQFRWVRAAAGDLYIVDGDGTIGYWAAAGTSGGVTSYTSPPGDFTTVTWTANVGLTRRFPDGTVLTFNGWGSEVSSTDRFGNATTFAYVNNSLPHSITDPTGHQITFDYRGIDAPTYNWGPGTLDGIYDGTGRSVYFGVDSANDLQVVNEPTGMSNTARLETRHLAYGAAHLLAQAQDARGAMTVYGYDYAGFLARVTSPAVVAEGNTQTLTTTLVSPAAATLVNPAASPGVLANPAPALGSAGIRVQSTDPKGNTTRYALDRWGAATRVESPLGRTAVVVRDDSARVVQTTSPAGLTTSFSWSGSDLITQSSTPVGGATRGPSVTMGYDPTYHQLLTVSGDAPPVQHYWSSGHLDSTTTGTGAQRSVTKYTYDGRGRVLTTKDGDGHGTTVAYQPDGFQNTQTITASGGRTTTYAYDGAGRVQRVTDPKGNVTMTDYDLLNRPQHVTAPDGGVTTFSYDALYLTAVIDAKGQTTGYSRNALGWVESDTSALAAPRRRYAYDRTGNVTAVTNRRNQTVTYTYDALNQRTSRTADGVTVAYGTDPQGRWTAAGTDTVYADEAGRPTSEVQWRNGNRFAVVSTYDVQGRRLSAGQPEWGMVARYHYDALGQLDSLTDFANGVSALQYDADHFPTGFRLANGITVSTPTTPTHNRESQLYTQAGYNQPDLNPAIGATYAYGPNGERTDRMRVVTNADGTVSGQEYRYDATGRLRGVAGYAFQQNTLCHWQTNDDGSQERVCAQAGKSYTDSTVYTYDQVGNRTDNGAQYAPGYENQLLAFGGVALNYDLDGNLSQKSWPGCGGTCVTQYRWDALNQLTGVWTNTGGWISGVAYDGWGRRLFRDRGGRTYFVYDGDNVSAEVAADGHHVIQYAYYPGVDRPHSMRQGGQVYYVHQDLSGNVVGVTDAGGSLVAQLGYTPFGALAAGSYANTTVNQQWKGREWDDAAQAYYVRARYYDPQLGRFLSEDPVGLSGGINVYAYAENDPVNAGDPSGLTICSGGDDCDPYELPSVTVTDQWAWEHNWMNQRWGTPGGVLGFGPATGTGGPPGGTGTGGTGSGSTPQPPSARHTVPACSAQSEWQFSVGGSATMALGLGLGSTASVSLNVGVTSSGRVFAQLQGAWGGELGLYLGAGVGGGVARSSGTPTGVSTSSGVFVAGAYGPFSGMVTRSFDGYYGASGGYPRFGPGMGAFVGGGTYGAVTLASPSLTGRDCRP